MKKLLCFCLIFTCFTLLAAFEKPEVEQLLLSYLENDSEIQNLSIALQKAELSAQKTQIQNGFDIQLSTGSITIRNVNGQTQVSAKPKTTLTLPQASNLTLNASTDFSTAQETAGNQTNELFTDTSISLSADIFSSNPDSHKIAQAKSERNVLVAKRNLTARAVTAEKEFYTQLKSLLSSTNQIIQEETSLYSDKISFEETRAKGYSSSSSTYRLAEMKVLSDEHSIESGRRSLLHDYIVFYMNCGFDVEYEVNEDFLNLLPADLPLSEPLNVLSYPRESYTEIENSQWNHKINSWERNQSKNFSLAANAGYTFKNRSTSSDTIDAGLSSTFQGVNLTGGINVPIGSGSSAGNSSPAYTFSATIDPNNFRTSKIDSQTDELTEQQELLAIQTAQTNYETAIVKSNQSLEKILWEKQTNEQNYEMYKKLAVDLEEYYKQGFIQESEYLSAKTNMQLYSVKILMNQLEIIIYNDDVQLMFVPEV